MTKVPVGKQHYIHHWRKIGLQHIRKLLRKDFDYVEVVAGYEGFGKTTLAIQDAYFVDKKFSIDRVCLSGEEFIEVVQKAPRYSAVVLDEAGPAMFSRDAIRGLNKTLAKLFMVVRHKNLFLVLVLPNFHFIDYYIRVHRISSLTLVLGRGKFAVYNKAKVRNLTTMRSRFMDYRKVIPSFRGDFLKHNPLQREYDEKVARLGKMGFLDKKAQKKSNKPSCPECGGGVFRHNFTMGVSVCRRCGAKIDPTMLRTGNSGAKT